MPEQYARPSAKGRRRFITVLLLLVILASAAGFTLARRHDPRAVPVPQVRII